MQRAVLPLAPGRIGPVEVGISKDAAIATGLSDADLDNGVCETPDLTWKKQFAGVNVLTDPDGTITSLGVIDADGPRTTDDLGVGSTFGELIETYGGDLSAPEAAGFGQVGVFVQDGKNWLGYLFGDATAIEQVDNDPRLHGHLRRGHHEAQARPDPRRLLTQRTASSASGSVNAPA